MFSIVAETDILAAPSIICSNVQAKVIEMARVSWLLQAHQLHILQQQNLQNPMLGGSQNTSIQRQASLGLVTSPQSPSPSSTPVPTHQQSQGLSTSSPQQLTQVSLSSATSPTEHGSYCSSLRFGLASCTYSNKTLYFVSALLN